jgi:hypothetical protein
MWTWVLCQIRRTRHDLYKRERDTVGRIIELLHLLPERYSQQPNLRLGCGRGNPPTLPPTSPRPQNAEVMR